MCLVKLRITSPIGTSGTMGSAPPVINEECSVPHVQTTVDYGHYDPIATYLSGTLHNQTIHYLFPSVSQAHSPDITRLVREVAKNTNIAFNELDILGGDIQAN